MLESQLINILPAPRNSFNAVLRGDTDDHMAKMTSRIAYRKMAVKSLKRFSITRRQLSFYTERSSQRQLKELTSRSVHLEKFSLNFSSWLFAIRVNLLHP